MKVYRAEQIRNVALISHVGAGKTSLVDAALFDSGAVTRQGKVDDGSSIADYDPDELKRRMTLHAKVIPVEWKNTKINFIDTPGYADFVGEVKAGLRVADAALVVVTAEKGVEVGTELTWQYAGERNLHISAVTLGELQAGIEITCEQDRVRAAEIEVWIDHIAKTWNVLPMDAATFRVWATSYLASTEATFQQQRPST